MIIKAIKVPLYPGKLVIIITGSLKKAKKNISIFKDDYIYASSYFDVYKKDQGFYVLLNFNYHKKIYHGTIAHEAVHIAHFIMTHSGLIDSFDNDEPKAYLVGWITNQIYKVIKQTKYKIK